MGVLSVRLLGRFDVRFGHQAPTGLEARKVQELLSYLLLYRGRPHAREVLASLLWGDHTTSQSRRYLRKALWQLQAAVGSQGNCAVQGILHVEPEWVQVSPAADFSLDVATFEEALDVTRGVPARELEPQHVQRLRAAADLYRGDLLEGWYQDWCVYERERLQNMYLGLLDKLMDFCEAHHEYEVGLAYGARILRLDRAHERTHRRLMRLYYLSGDRTMALRQYQRCVTALQEELGAEPGDHTVALWSQVRTGRVYSLTTAGAEGDAVTEAIPVRLSEALACLKQLREAVVDVERRLQRDVQAIEAALTQG